MMVLLLILWFGPLVLSQEASAGSCGSGESGWIGVPASTISADDVAHWPHTAGLLVKWVAFLGTLHWPACCLDLGVGGIS